MTTGSSDGTPPPPPDDTTDGDTTAGLVCPEPCDYATDCFDGIDNDAGLAMNRWSHPSSACSTVSR
jgi:hypothetical protein